MPEEIKDSPIEIVYAYKEGKTIALNDYQQTQVINLLSNHFARLKLIRTKYVNSSEMGLHFYISGNNDDIFFFSEEIVVINGVQYKIYGTSLAQQLKNTVAQ